jgi:hypothetical protein
MNRILSASLATLLVISISGCMVRVDKDEKGQEKNVQVDTPFGHVHVNTDQTTAADLGLPVYPGAQMIKDNDEHKSADVNVGFGQWEIKVKAVSFITSDSRDKVIDFYKKALGHYGTVIVCQDKTAVGTPSTTDEGLTCSDDSAHGHIQMNAHHDDKGIVVNAGNEKDGFQLKVGSRKHQHILGFDDSSDNKTHFELVALDLPIDSSSNNDKKN